MSNFQPFTKMTFSFEGKDHLEDQTSEVRKILKWTLERLMGKPEGRRPLGRTTHRWVDNIKMDLGEVGWGDVDWVHLTQGRNRWRALVNSVKNWETIEWPNILVTSRVVLSSIELVRERWCELVSTGSGWCHLRTHSSKIMNLSS
jgi:hypothetical protein